LDGSRHKFTPQGYPITVIRQDLDKDRPFPQPKVTLTSQGLQWTIDAQNAILDDNTYLFVDLGSYPDPSFAFMQGLFKISPERI
jgi:hypothetical protein